MTVAPVEARRRLDRWALLLTLVALAALIVPLRQNAALQLLFNFAHIPVFAVLAWLWGEDLLGRDWTLMRRLVAVLVVGMLIAAGSEALQAFVPGRYADMGDMFRNMLGIALGMSIHAIWPGVLVKRITG